MIDLWVARGGRIQASTIVNDQMCSLFDIEIMTTFVPSSVDSLRSHNRCKTPTHYNAMKAILYFRQRYNKPPASSEGLQPRQGQVGGYCAGGSRKAADSMILYEKP